jgi:hypothetical protein
VEQLGHVSPTGFLGGQFFMLGVGGPLWVIGLLALLLAPSLRRFRPAGLLALTVLLLLLVGGGKDYYFGPIHPLLIAAATALPGGWLDRPGRTPVFAVAVVLLLLGGAALLPVGIPLLPPERMAHYAAALGLAHTTATNRGESLPLPQDFADMTGWREQVEAVSRVFHSLSVDEQRSPAPSRSFTVSTGYPIPSAATAISAFGEPASGATDRRSCWVVHWKSFCHCGAK